MAKFIKPPAAPAPIKMEPTPNLRLNKTPIMVKAPPPAKVFVKTEKMFNVRAAIASTRETISRLQSIGLEKVLQALEENLNSLEYEIKGEDGLVSSEKVNTLVNAMLRAANAQSKLSSVVQVINQLRGRLHNTAVSVGTLNPKKKPTLAAYMESAAASAAAPLLDLKHKARIKKLVIKIRNERARTGGFYGKQNLIGDILKQFAEKYRPAIKWGLQAGTDTYGFEKFFKPARKTKRTV